MSSATDSKDGFCDPMSVTAVLESIVDEKRASPRHRRRLKARVVRLGSRGVVEAATRDISEGGLFLTMERASELCVGQRCEVELFEPGGSPLSCLAGNSCYATVVRTEVISSDAPLRLIGAGLRFDQPLYL